MLLSFKKNLFLITLVSGTFIAASSSSWFTCWLGLEINLMSLIPLVINKINPSSTESGIKYFIAQAMASVILIISATLVSMKAPTNSLSIIFFLLTMSISIKIGAAPFHFWLPQVIQSSEWSQILIILTWQKIAPMTLVMLSSNSFFYLVIYSSCLVGVMGAINQTSFKKIMVYSSILHSAWMISLILCSEAVWWLYFLVYTIISSSIMFSLIVSPLNSLKQLYNSITSTDSSFLIFSNFFSLAGIPPMTGFFMKLISIMVMINLSVNLLTLIILILSSLLALYFYIRLIFSASVISSNLLNMNFFLLKNFSSTYSILLVISILGNISLPVFLFFA
uniref:NADH-ubiquinone oxidoreductase chain 2 n=1 Tax=Onychiurus orientalis TaxID=280588 RepID=Q6DVI0_ONYOR|nr:NADH dehydrogenase subunit 2 [Onychiurus orientalis]AAT69319.1 NADH dehydrogenase subunit 2 [Onychiurus orientalis]